VRQCRGENRRERTWEGADDEPVGEDEQSAKAQEAKEGVQKRHDVLSAKRPNGSRLGCGRLARPRKSVGRSPCSARA